MILHYHQRLIEHRSNRPPTSQNNTKHKNLRKYLIVNFYNISCTGTKYWISLGFKGQEISLVYFGTSQKPNRYLGKISPHSQYKGAVAGFLPTTESNLRTAMGVEICKSFHYRPHLQTACKDVYRSVWRDVLAICSDLKRGVNGLQIYKGHSICLTAQFEY